MTDKFHGQTRASMEHVADREQMNALDRAEKKSGFLTGIRRLGKGMALVSVVFYPKTMFWVQDVVRMSPTYEYGPHRELTQEEWDRTSSFL